jgi:transcriptional regulator with XRE-family HTH domain
MGTHQRVTDLAAEDARRINEKVRTDVRDTRITLGLSQVEVARQSGVSRWKIGRLEAGKAGSLSIADSCALLRAVGLTPYLTTAPTGVRVRDGASLRILERFASLLAPPLRLSREVLLPAPGDLRAWDAAVAEDRRRAFVEVVSRLGDMQALARYLAIKLRDDGRSQVVILVVGRTAHNRGVLAAHRESLRDAFPHDGATIARALRSGRLPSASGIIVL